MNECFDTHGGDDCWAIVSCPDAGVYVTRHYDLYETTWIDSVGSKYDKHHTTQRKAIDKFLELRQSTE